MSLYLSFTIFPFFNLSLLFFNSNSFSLSFSYLLPFLVYFTHHFYPFIHILLSASISTIPSFFIFPTVFLTSFFFIPLPTYSSACLCSSFLSLSLFCSLCSLVLILNPLCHYVLWKKVMQPDAIILLNPFSFQSSKQPSTLFYDREKSIATKNS